MKRMLSILTALLLFITYCSYSQRGDDYKDRVIAEIGKEKITFGEIEHAYQKNMNRKNTNLYDLRLDSINNFLNLFINYRLKVQDAIGRGFDKDSAIMNEINQNRRLVAESFFYERELVKPNVEKLLKMRENEYKVAVIIIEIPQTDTITGFKRASEALSRIKKGESFDRIANEYSAEKESAQNGGIIQRYITAGSVQSTIEKIIYSTPEGQVYPEAVKLNGAYFIIKVLEKQPRMFRLGSHILISIKDEDTLAAKKKVDSVYALLLKGANFKRLAEEVSDDNATSMYGGSLNDYYSRSTGFFKTGSPLLTEFEQKLFSLKPSEISTPLKTEFGYHIIKLDSIKGLDKEAERVHLERLYNKLYFEDDKKAFNDSLRNAFSFFINPKTLAQFLNKVDTSKTVLTENWDYQIDEKLSKETLFEFQGHKKSVKDFINRLNNDNKFKGTALNSKGITSAIKTIVDPEVFNAATEKLEEKYPEFSIIMKEFHDGILLFKVAELEVWKKLKFDSLEARKYWEPIKDNFKTTPKYDISEIFVLNDSIAKSLSERIKKGEDFSKLASEYTQRSGYRERNGRWGILQPDKNDLAKKAQENKAKKGEIIGPFKYERGVSIILVNDYLPVRTKTFEEAIPDFAPEFQDLAQKNLEDNWIQKLKKTYPVIIHDDTLKDIINKMHNY